MKQNLTKAKEITELMVKRERKKRDAVVCVVVVMVVVMIMVMIMVMIVVMGVVMMSSMSHELDDMHTHMDDMHTHMDDTTTTNNNNYNPHSFTRLMQRSWQSSYVMSPNQSMRALKESMCCNSKPSQASGHWVLKHQNPHQRRISLRKSMKVAKQKMGL